MLGLSALVISAPNCVFAQTLAQLPVVQTVQDYQGVDVSSGAYVAKSPFSLAAPGAARLGSATMFNGRAFTYGLNIYLRDETYVPFQMDYTIRELTVNYGGKARFFRCPGVGACQHLDVHDGSTLTRLEMHQVLNGVSGEDRYEYTDKDGTVVSFFNPVYESVGYCGDYDSGCNAAWYSAFAYASTVKFPNGEKLTYDPLAVVEQADGLTWGANTVHSNLGYDLKFATTIPSNWNLPTKAGVWWLRGIVGEDENLKITLSSANSVVGLVHATRTYTQTHFPQIIGTVLTLSQFDEWDILGRHYALNFTTYGYAFCPGMFDLSNPVISRETTPAGRITDIGHNASINTSIGIFPATSVTRGGRVWTYGYNEPGRPGVTATDPLGGKRSSESFTTMNPLTKGPSYCMPAYIPMLPTTQIDELGRQTHFGYNPTTQLVAEITYPEGDGIRYVKDGRDNILMVYRKAKNATEQLIYQADYDTNCTNPVTCNSPNWVRDANGNQTDYTYDSVHGGVLTETRPAVNGLRSQLRTTYEANDTGSGIVYRLKQTSECRTLASCTNSPDELRVVYTYWRNTFLPASITRMAGDGSVTSTISFEYDEAGRVTRSIDPMGASTYSRYDAAGRLVGEILPGNIARRVTYNDDNQILTEEKGVVPGPSDNDWTQFSPREILTNTYNSGGDLVKAVRSAP